MGSSRASEPQGRRVSSERPAARPTIAGAQRGWWLEDAVPGTILRHPGGRTIGPDEHVWLAWVTHNISGVHGNADAATRTEWGQPLVLGMLTAAVVIGLASPATPEPDQAAIGWDDGWSSIRLAAPVLAGDTLTAESEIARARGGPIGRTPWSSPAPHPGPKPAGRGRGAHRGGA